MTSEQPAEQTHITVTPAKAVSRRRRSEQRHLWLSRASFVLSGLALASVGYRTISRHASDASPAAAVAVTLPDTPSAVVVESPQVEVVAPAAVEPKTTTPSVSERVQARVQASLDKGLRALKIKRLVVTQAVEDREPVAVGNVVAPETPVIAFLEVASGSAEEQQVVVTFEHEAGEQAGLVNLSVPGNKPRWRTWGRTYNINRDGRWTAVVRDSRGEELGRTEFTVRRES